VSISVVINLQFEFKTWDYFICFFVFFFLVFVGFTYYAYL
jgi:hypothetical protein